MLEAGWALAQAGGATALVLLGISAALYGSVAARALRLRAGRRVAFEVACQRWIDAGSDGASTALPRFIDAVRALPERGARARQLEVARRELERGAAWIGALVMVAPLLGLLGTVSGMVDTFASLHEASAHAAAMNVEAHLEERTVAAGIARALVTTQLGLVVAVPGLLMERWLSRRARRRVRELEMAAAAVEARWAKGGALDGAREAQP